MGLGAATHHEITFKDGLVEQHNFYDYKMPRISDIPPMDVHIMEKDADAGSKGEPGLPPICSCFNKCNFRPHWKTHQKLAF